MRELPLAAFKRTLYNRSVAAPRLRRSANALTARRALRAKRDRTPHRPKVGIINNVGAILAPNDDMLLVEPDGIEPTT